MSTDDPHRMPTTCERYRRGRPCGEKAIGASFDVNGEYGIGYCEKHEPLYESIRRLRRDHPLFDAYVEMRWLDHLGRIMASPFVVVWKAVRRGTR